MVWLSEEAIPSLFCNDALLKTQLICSDEDPQLYGSFQYSARKFLSKYGPIALTRLCKWHKVQNKIQNVINNTLTLSTCAFHR